VSFHATTILFILIVALTLAHTSYSQAVCSSPSNLLAWYSFENNITDVSGNAMHGIPLSPSQFISNGAIGSALQINASSGYFKANNFTFSLSIARPELSICFWLLPKSSLFSSTQTLMYIVSKPSMLLSKPLVANNSC